ncbi:response regulator transcription factor [Cytobacillus spongiae]|uniref:response regulator transcription factor n=1 Tax=Cytobacillus spongiae TaxID=2901381 RepID=UPI001F2C89EC|nr:response regulator transcription factor [Cytobacillus spongiae]UII58008.1 response regulator transcription factor [Cytobacillus spongiae]
MKTILYIEDDQEIGSWVKGDLEDRGFQVIWLTSGDQAVEFVERANLVILDVMLPGLDGFTVGQRLKKSAPDTPILMLSARTSVDDKLQGLQFADDYVTKPFHPDELVARVDVLFRRYGQSLSNELSLGHVKVYFSENRMVDERTGEELILTGKQHQIFMYFLRHPNQILTKEQIYEAVWGEPYLEGDKTLMVHIRHLREKLELDPSEPTIIETIRGLGYRVKQ